MVSRAIVGGGGMVGTAEVTTAGAAAAARSSRFACSSTEGSGTTGIWKLIALFSANPASSSRMRRISYAGVSMYRLGTSTTCTLLLASMLFSHSRFSFMR